MQIMFTDPPTFHAYSFFGLIKQIKLNLSAQNNFLKKCQSTDNQTHASAFCLVSILNGLD